MRAALVASFAFLCFVVLLSGAGVRAGEDETPAPPASATSAEAPRRPMLWVLEGETPVYLFGTIHLPDPRVTELLDVVVQAFDASDTFFAEVALEPGAQAAVQHLLFLEGETTLEDLLGEALYARVAPRMAAKGVPAPLLERFKPWVVTFQLLQDAVTPKATGQEDDAGGAEADPAAPAGPPQAMDLTLYQNAVASGKEAGGLETIDEQIAVFDRQTAEDQKQMLEDILDVLEQMDGDGGGARDEDGGEAARFSEMLASLVRLYRAGDEVGLGRTMAALTAEGGETMASFMEALLDDRNVRMADRILAQRAKRPGEVLFVAVGAGHFPGEKGILALLRAKGHTVTRLEADAEIPAAPKEAPRPVTTE